MRSPAETISSMPSDGEQRQHANSAVSSLARARLSSDMTSTSAAPARTSSLEKRLKASTDEGALEQHLARLAAVDDEAGGDDQHDDGEPAGDVVGARRRIVRNTPEHQDAPWRRPRGRSRAASARKTDNSFMRPVLYLGAGAGAAGAGAGAGAVAGAAAGLAGRTAAS